MATIQIKRSITSPADLSSMSLAIGELAYTYGSEAAGTKLYIGNEQGNSHYVIGGKTFTDMLDHTAGTLTASSALLADSTSAMSSVIVGNNASAAGTLVFNEATNNGTAKITLAGVADIGAEDKTITLPNATDTLIGKATTDILTNKTLTSPTINTPTITGNVTFSDGAYDFDIASHDTSNGLKLGGVLVSATAAELNILDGVTSTTAELNLLDGVSGLVQGDFTKLAAIDASATELNLIDGGTSRGTTAVASGDGILINDGGTMRMTNVDTVSTYFASHSVGGGNIVTTGALNSGSITSGFGTIDTGSSTITTSGAITGGSLVADLTTIDSNGITTSSGDFTINPSGNIAVGSNRITGLSDPSSAQDAATKAYVDAVKTGLDVKDSVRVATTANITIADDLDAGDTIDGVTLVAGDRVLVKNQDTGSQNGIYVSHADTPFRATDFDADAEVTAGAFTFVEEGTANSDSGWVLTTNGDITVGSTAIAFAQFSGAGQVTAGTGLTKSGNTINAIGTANRISVAADAINIDTGYVGQTSLTTLGTIGTGTWEATDVAVAHGGTGVSTFTSNGILYGNGTSAVQVTAAGTDTYFLYSNSGTPAWTNTVDGGTF